MDIRLAGGGLGTDIPARLKKQGRMGVLYASGHAGPIGLTKTDGDALLVKPYRPEDAVRALRVVEGIVSTDPVSEHFLRGFSLLDRPSKTDKDTELTGQINRLSRQQMELAKFGTFALSEHDLGNVLAAATAFPRSAWGRHTPRSTNTALRKTICWSRLGSAGTKE